MSEYSTDSARTPGIIPIAASVGSSLQMQSSVPWMQQDQSDCISALGTSGAE